MHSCRAPELFATRTTGRLSSTTEIPPTLANHKIARRTNHTTNFFNDKGLFEHEIGALRNRFLPVGLAIDNCKDNGISIGRVSACAFKNCEPLGTHIEIEYQSLVFRSVQFIPNLLRIGTFLRDNPKLTEQWRQGGRSFFVRDYKRPNFNGAMHR